MSPAAHQPASGTRHPPAAAPVQPVLGVQRSVQCVHCACTFQVAQMAQVLTCPTCYKRVRVDDIIIEGDDFSPKLETCGRLIVRRKGRASSRMVRASLGVEVLGELEAHYVTTGRVYIGPKARWRGDCVAEAIVIETGAQILGGHFQINPRVLETPVEPTAEEPQPELKPTAPAPTDVSL